MNRFGIVLIFLLSCSMMMAATGPTNAKKQRSESRIRKSMTRGDVQLQKKHSIGRPAFVPQSSGAVAADITKINQFPFQTPFADGDSYCNAFPVVLDDERYIFHKTHGRRIFCNEEIDACEIIASI